MQISARSALGPWSNGLPDRRAKRSDCHSGKGGSMQSFGRPCVVSWAIGALLLTAGSGAQEVLPKPDSPFKGKIGRTVKDSKPDFPKGVEAPKGAPNVLLILTDDVGFGASTPFGGPIQT